jgi:hypothetical protein
MKLNKQTLLHLRSALIMVLKAIDATLLEGFGWTPRGSSSQLTDRIE